MSKFQYKAMTEDGQFVTGEVEAKDRLTAIEKLADQKRTLFELSDPDGTLGFFNFPKIPLSGISPNTVAVSTRQLSEVLGAGMPLVESLGALVNSGTNQKMTEVWQDVIQSILKGQTLSHALAQHPKVFSQLYVNLVKVGEATGRLHEMIGEARCARHSPTRCSSSSLVVFCATPLYRFFFPNSSRYGIKPEWICRPIL